MTYSPRDTPLTAAVLAVIGGLLIVTLSELTAAIPPPIALGYALAMSLGALSGLIWWQGHRRQAVPLSVPAIIVVTGLATFIGLLIRLAERSWIASGTEPAWAMPGKTGLAFLLLSCVFRPVAEEALLRGYVLEQLRGAGSEVELLIANAVLSTVIAGNPGHALSNAVLGGLLALIVLRTRRLWIAAMIHILNSLTERSISAWSPSLLHAMSRPSASAVLLAAALLIGVVLVRKLKRANGDR